MPTPALLPMGLGPSAPSGRPTTTPPPPSVPINSCSSGAYWLMWDGTVLTVAGTIPTVAGTVLTVAGTVLMPALVHEAPPGSGPPSGPSMPAAAALATATSWHCSPVEVPRGSARRCTRSCGFGVPELDTAAAAAAGTAGDAREVPGRRQQAASAGNTDASAAAAVEGGCSCGAAAGAATKPVSGRGVGPPLPDPDPDPAVAAARLLVAGWPAVAAVAAAAAAG